MDMVRLGDTLTCHGVVKSKTINDDLSESVTVECWAQNQKGDKVTAGEAVVVVPNTQRNEASV
jgi:acyl dehydratase